VVVVQVVEIRAQSADPDLIKAAQYTFDIVTDTRVLSIAVESEELRTKWLTALRYAKDRSRNQMGPSLARLRDSELLDLDKVIQKWEMFKKQVTIFHKIMADDQESVMKDQLGNLDASNSEQVFRFLRENLDGCGLGDQLLKLMHQLLLLPLDFHLGRDTWEVLQRVVGDLRDYDRSRRTNADGWLVSIEDLQTLVLARREMDAKIRRVRVSEGELPAPAQGGANDDLLRSLEAEVRDLQARLAKAELGGEWLVDMLALGPLGASRWWLTQGAVVGRSQGRGGLPSTRPWGIRSQTTPSGHPRCPWWPRRRCPPSWTRAARAAGRPRVAGRRRTPWRRCWPAGRPRGRRRKGPRPRPRRPRTRRPPGPCTRWRR
jgi:hypothetical protein